MKKLFIFSVLVVVFVGFTVSGCGGKKDNKSSEKDIKTFTVNGDPWDISGTNITKLYPKGTTITTFEPTIVVSEKASVSPTGPQDFSNEKTVTYTVKAEDGSTKPYTAKATVSTTP